MADMEDERIVALQAIKNEVLWCLHNSMGREVQRRLGLAIHAIDVLIAEEESDMQFLIDDAIANGQ